MICETEIFKNIDNCDITPRSGFEDEAWIMNHSDAVFTFGAYYNLITLITLGSGFSYTVNTVKKEMNGGFDMGITDLGDSFFHRYEISPFQRDAESIKNMDDMNAILVIAELKGSKTEGCFVAYGVEVGLYKSGAGQDVNGNNGLATYEFTTPPDLGERYSRFIIWDTDYETTKAMIEGLAISTRLIGMDGSGLLGMGGSKLIGVS